MGDVVYNTGIISKLDLPVQRILETALAEGLDTVVICGYTKDGDEYFASSVADGGTTLWLLERMKLMLLREADDPGRENSPDACA